jgi:hypothetical protein
MKTAEATTEMDVLIRESLSDLRQNASADPLALVPIEGMAPHYMGFTDKAGDEKYRYLFPVNVDGTTVHVFLKRG